MKAGRITETWIAARAVLPLPVFDFADGGAEDERTLRRNAEVFGAVDLLPRPLNGAATRDLSITPFGRRLAIAPPGLAGLPSWASHGSVCRLEDIAATGADPRRIQVFVHAQQRSIVERP